MPKTELMFDLKNPFAITIINNDGKNKTSCPLDNIKSPRHINDAPIVIHLRCPMILSAIYPPNIGVK